MQVTPHSQVLVPCLLPSLAPALAPVLTTGDKVLTTGAEEEEEGAEVEEEGVEVVEEEGDPRIRLSSQNHLLLSHLMKS